MCDLSISVARLLFTCQCEELCSDSLHSTASLLRAAVAAVPVGQAVSLSCGLQQLITSGAAGHAVALAAPVAVVTGLLKHIGNTDYLGRHQVLRVRICRIRMFFV
jgi:hypothetical protein